MTNPAKEAQYLYPWEKGTPRPICPPGPRRRQRTHSLPDNTHTLAAIRQTLRSEFDDIATTAALAALSITTQNSQRRGAQQTGRVERARRFQRPESGPGR